MFEKHFLLPSSPPSYSHPNAFRPLLATYCKRHLRWRTQAAWAKNVLLHPLYVPKTEKNVHALPKPYVTLACDDDHPIQAYKKCLPCAVERPTTAITRTILFGQIQNPFVYSSFKLT